MRPLICALVLSFSLSSFAEKVKFSFVNEDIAKMAESYSKATGQKFILDPGVRGKITVLNPREVSVEESFSQLSMALAIHGYSIVKQDNVMIIRPSRAAQRSLIETTTELPTLNPERVVTWVVTLKYIASHDFNQQFRNITTKDGDINSFAKTNQLIITDYTSNLHRIAELLKLVDKPADPKVAKLVEQNLQKEEEYRKAQLARSAAKQSD